MRHVQRQREQAEEPLLGLQQEEAPVQVHPQVQRRGQAEEEAAPGGGDVAGVHPKHHQAVHAEQRSAAHE